METKPFVIIRTENAGCFAGYLASRSEDGEEATLIDCIRLWYWSGAASLSQLAAEGTSDPKNCKFPPAVKEHTMRSVLEIIAVSDNAKISIQAVKPWRA